MYICEYWIHFLCILVFWRVISITCYSLYMIFAYMLFCLHIVFTYYFVYIVICLHVFFSCFYVYILFYLHSFVRVSMLTYHLEYIGFYSCFYFCILFCLQQMYFFRDFMFTYYFVYIVLCLHWFFFVFLCLHIILFTL